MDSQPFLITLFQTARAWRQVLDRRLSPLGLSQAKWRVLLQLSHSSYPLSQKELAQRMGIEGPTLVRLIDRLQRDNWVERHSDSQDRRSKTVHLTQKARRTLKGVNRISEELKVEALSTIPEKELCSCIHVLGLIKSKLLEELADHSP